MNTLFRIFAVIFILCIADVNNAYTTEGHKKDIEIVVHRGANFLAPENTIPAAFAALEHGATWIELDVRKSKDGVMYNLHDETLDRTTNGHGPINMAISSYIDKLDAGSWFSPAFKGVKVPRIETMLDTLKGKANVFFDVKKGTSVSNLVELVRKKGFANNCFFWFADPQMIPEFVKIAPEMKIKVNASDIEGIKKWQTVCKPSYVEISPENITKDFSEYCHKNGILIMAAIQNGNEESYKKAILAQPDLVNIDRPELWERVLAESFESVPVGPSCPFDIIM